MEKKFSPSPFFLWLKVIDTRAEILVFLTRVSHMNLCSHIAKLHLVATLVSLIAMLEATWTFLHYVAAKHIGMSPLRFQILTCSAQRSINTTIYKILWSH